MSSNDNSYQTDPNEMRSKATAYHEAGHAVMAATLGRSIHKVSISPGQLATGQMRLGVCNINKSSGKKAHDPTEDFILILLAGMVAESRLTDQYCRRGASSDLTEARRLMSSRAKTERQFQKLEQRLLEKCEYLLDDEAVSKAIELVAKDLLEKTTISGRAVQHWLEEAKRQVN